MMSHLLSSAGAGDFTSVPRSRDRDVDTMLHMSRVPSATRDIADEAPGTGGGKKVKTYRRPRVTCGRWARRSVGRARISLGSSSVMNASHPEGAEQIAGGILAICGPADVSTAVAHIEQRRAPGHPSTRSRDVRRVLLPRSAILAGPAKSRASKPLIEHVVGLTTGSRPRVVRNSSVKNIQNSARSASDTSRRDDEVVPVVHAHETRRSGAGETTTFASG